MARLNKEEYEILKTYISEEKYIAKDRDGSIRLLADYPERDMKREGWSDGWGKSTLKNSANNFQFIQWEDEEPYEIAELIREYKIKELRIAPSGTVIVDSFNESEEKEVKKNKEWLRNEIKNLQVYTNNPTFGRFDQIRLWDVEKLIDQLDEPEVLSQEWIDENKVARINNLRKMTMSDVVPAEDLQNLIIPKQELSVIPKYVADWIEKYIEYGYDLYPALKKMENNSRIWKKTYEWYRKNTHAFVNAYLTGEYEVEEEQKYYVLNNQNYFLLTKDEVRGFVFSIGGDSKLGDTDNISATFKLTEQEIKDYDERYLAFKVPVEEVTE